MDNINFLAQTECNLKLEQANIGKKIIYATGISCITIVGFVILGVASKGATAQLILSEQFMHLIFVLAILLIIGLIAGIILIKTSVKHISKSYFACLDMIFARLQIEIEKEIEDEEKANNQKKSNISKS